MVGRVLGVVLVLLALGAGAGWGVGVLLDDDPGTIAVARPLPAASPSAPVEPERPYSPDIDYPTLPTSLPYVDHVVGEGEFLWGYRAPEGWDIGNPGPNEVTWRPHLSPVGSYGMRVKVVTERKTPEAMVEQKTSDLADAVQDVRVLGTSADSLDITYRTSSNQLRYNSFRWFTRPGRADAQFEVSVSGRAQDVPGLDALLDQIAASVRFDPPEPEPSGSASPDAVAPG